MMHAHFFNKPYEGVSSTHEVLLIVTRVLLIVTRTLLLAVCCAFTSLVIQHSKYKVQLTHSSMFMFFELIYSRKFSMCEAFAVQGYKVNCLLYSGSASCSRQAAYLT